MSSNYSNKFWQPYQSKWERLRKIASGPLWGLFTLIFGFLSGLFIANLFYSKTAAELKEELVISAISEIRVNLDPSAFQHYNDSLFAIDSGHPFPYLESSALRQLIIRHNIFDIPDSLRLKSLLYDMKFNINDFNTRIELRNLSILRGSKFVVPHNVKAYNYYRDKIIPKSNELIDFLESNLESLIS